LSLFTFYTLLALGTVANAQFCYVANSGGSNTVKRYISPMCPISPIPATPKIVHYPIAGFDLPATGISWSYPYR